MRHILGEGLGGQLQAFDHGQVGEELVGKLLHRHAVANGECCRLDEFAGLGGHRLDAEQASGASFGDQLDEAARVEVGQGAGDVVQAQCAAVGLYALSLRLRLAQSHRGHLRVGEHHGRHGGEVERRLATGHVDGGSRAPGCGHIDELRLIGAVACGVNLRHSGAQVVIDHDGAARIALHAGSVQIERRGVGRAARGHQQALGPNLALVRGQREAAVGVGHRADLGVGQHGEALFAQRGGEGLTDVRVFARQQGVARQEGDLAAQAGVGLGQFQRHNRRTDDRQARRNRVTFQRLGRRPVRRGLQTSNGGNGRAGAGGDQAAVKAHPAFAAVVQRHDQRSGVFEPSRAAQGGDGRLAFENAFILGVAQLIHARLLLREQLVAQDGGRARLDARVERAVAPQMGDVRGADHDFGRYAADVDAGAADHPALDQRDLRAAVGRLDRRRHRRAAAADDGNVQTARVTAGRMGRVGCAVRCRGRVDRLFRRVAGLGHGCSHRVERDAGIGDDLGRPLRIRDLRGFHARQLFQDVLDVGGAGVAGHAADAQDFHGLLFGLEGAGSDRLGRVRAPATAKHDRLITVGLLHDRRGIARIGGGFDQGFDGGLGIVEGDHGVFLDLIHTHFFHARNGGERFVHGDRADPAGHARHGEGHGLLGSPGRGAENAGGGNSSQELVHEDSFRFNKTGERHREKPAPRQSARRRSRTAAGRWR